MYTPGTTITSTGTAVASPIPLDAQGGFPTTIRLSASAPAYVRLTNDGTAAVAGDLLVQPGDDVVLWAASFKSISVLSVSGTASVYVHPDDVGQWSGINPTSLDLNFRASTTLDSRITFARADAVTCATYFDSTGRLATAAANVARFDYDPASPAGVTGPELVTNGDFSQGSTGWTASPGTQVSQLSGSAWRIASTDGSAASVAQTALTPTAGKTYRITLEIVSTSGSGLLVDFGGATSPALTTIGVKTFDLKCSNTVALVVKRGGVCDSVFDNISVQEVTFTPRGLLIEESRQNLLLHSRDMTQAAWTKTDVTPARTQVGIDGVANTACLMTEGSGNTAITQPTTALTVAAGSTITASIVFKRGNTDWIRIVVAESALVDGCNAWFNLNTGVKGTTTARGAGTAITSSMTNLGGGWYRCVVTCLPNGAYTAAQVLFFSANADGGTNRVSGATYIVDCAQLEVGAFATSIIPTTTTALTRAADSASMTGTNFSSWFNASAGTFVAEFDSVTTGSVATRVWQASSSGSEATYMRLEGTASGYSGNSSTADWTLSYSAGRVGTFKSAVAYAANDCALSFGGVLTATDSTTTLPASLAVLGLGGSLYVANRELNGHIRRLTYYPSRLANATLVSLTA